MASNVVNQPGIPSIQRGKPVNLGSLGAAADVVQFTVTREESTPNGFDELVIFTTGGATTPALEVSIDGGTTWALVVAPTSASSLATFTAAASNGDTAVTSATGYSIAGLQGFGIFRFGGRTAGTAVVWVAIA